MYIFMVFFVFMNAILEWDSDVGMITHCLAVIEYVFCLFVCLIFLELYTTKTPCGILEETRLFGAMVS